MIPRQLTPDEVEFEFEALPEDIEVRGNALASGDDDEDKACEDEIIERLDRGDIYAWFMAKVTARWEGFEGTSYLGCCSCKSRKDWLMDAYHSN